MTIWTPDQNADLDSHHIEGIAREGNTPFSVSLISHVEGNLWQGGCINGVKLFDFKYVVSLYPWEKYDLVNGNRVEVEMYDAGEIPDEHLLYGLARLISHFASEAKTLVHCQAGLNRSGLLASLALIVGGMPPVDAIALLREKRSPAVLCNKTFEKWLLERP